MPRKRRKQVAEELKRPARYADRAPHWLRKIAEEVEELADAVPIEKKWKTPTYVYLQFSRKDPRKEEQRHEAIQRQRSRAGSRR